MTPPLALTVAEAAAYEQVSERHLRRMIARGVIAAARSTVGRNATGLLVPPSALSPAAQARFYAARPDALAPRAEGPHADSDGAEGADAGRKSTPSYAGAPQSLRQRADLRLEAILSWRRAVTQAHATGDLVTAAEAAWLARFRYTHAGFRVSIPSVKRWDRAYRAAGNSLDALVDGNDGHGRSGATALDPELEADFRAMWLQPTRPKVSVCYRQLEKIAAVRGVKLLSYSTFRRLAASIPPIVAAYCREEAESSIRPFVLRDYYSLAALDLVQNDDHQADVAVHCGDPLCDRGHYPWVTAWIDVRSRKVLAFDVHIECTNSRHLLGALKRLMLDNGKMNGVYLDNGGPQKRAMGVTRRHREWGKARAKLIATDISGPQLEHRLAPLSVRVVFAIPFNPQAKLIERLFRTLVDQAWRGFPSYRGMLGQRSEEAERLRKNPQLLPTLSDLVIALQRTVDEYNARPHRGHGMDDRSPNEVFEATRVPRVDMSPMELALVFLESKTRKVRNNGIQWSRHEWYRLDDLAAQTAWFGKKVLVRYDPEDLETLILTTLEGQFISLAHQRDRATYNTRDAKTQEQIAIPPRDWKAIKQRIRQQNPAAAKRLEKVAATVEEYYSLVAQQQAMPVAASGGSGVVQMLPYESSLSRAVEEARTRVANPSGLSAADLELARSVETPSDGELAQFAEHHSFGGVITPREFRRPAADDDKSMDEVIDELEALRLQRVAREREAEGMCGWDIHCPNQAEIRGFCSRHYDELHGA